MKRFKKLWKWLLFLFLAAIFYGFYDLIPRSMVMTGDPVNKQRKLMASFQNPGEIGLDYDSVSYSGYEDFKLEAYYIPTTSVSATATIIMVHGIRAYKEHFLRKAPDIIAQGYNLVLVDLRAHGDSEGKFCTFGVKEKHDIKALIDVLIEKYNCKNIGIWGQSLGGAVAMQSLALDSRIQFGIIESTFSNFEKIAHDYIKRMGPFLPEWYRNFMIYRGEQMAGIKAENGNPMDAATNITQPVLIIHGTADNRISFDYAKENFEALKSENKTFLPVESATHTNVWQVGGLSYFEQIYSFINATAKP
ncbi:MAG: alpha/beta fold hydrolase [Bacteroidia bacterium]